MVPEHFARELRVEGRCVAAFRQTGYGHQDSYKDRHVLAATFYCIIKIVLEMKWSECAP